jgi:hypothetical protein
LAFTDEDPILTPLRKMAVGIIQTEIRKSNTIVEAAESLRVSERTLRRWRSLYPKELVS